MSDELTMIDALEEERDAIYTVLESNLTEEDQERLNGIRRELNAHILWKKVTSETFSALLRSLESIIFEGGEGVSSQGHAPFAQLFPAEQEFLDDKGTLRRDYVILQLMKKLLGSLKTRTKQAFSDLPSIGGGQEEKIREYLVEIERELLFEDLPNLDPLRELPVDEEEMDLVADLGPDDWESGEGFQQVAGHPQEVKSNMGEVYISADLNRPESSTNCHHLSTKSSYIGTGRDMIVREYCRHCRRVIRKEPLFESPNPSPRAKPDPKNCRHKALWVEGKEGQEAYCTICDLVPLPEPETYTWEDAGLEPYGDDPAQDQVLSLNEAIACES